MLWQIYVFVGILALGASGVAINKRVPIDLKVAAAVAAFILWTIWGMASYNVEVVTNTGTIIEEQYTPLVLVGLTTAAIALVYAVWNIMTMFGMDPKRLLAVRL